MEYLVRGARVTDIDRIVALSDGSVPFDPDRGSLGTADLMRQLVYMNVLMNVLAELRVRAGRTPD